MLLISASVSTLSSITLTACSTVSMDLIKASWLKGLGEKTLATVTRLPDGSCWVLAANFGSGSATLRIPLPVSGAAQDIVDQTSLAVQGGLTVTLNGRSARHYLVGAAASPKEPS